MTRKINPAKGPYTVWPTHWAGGNTSLGERNTIHIDVQNGRTLAFINHKANTLTDGWGGPSDEDYATAYLMAASFDLLKACKSVQTIRDQDYDWDYVELVIDEVDKAVAKSEYRVDKPR
jgi:hypothetical protein